MRTNKLKALVFGYNPKLVAELNDNPNLSTKVVTSVKTFKFLLTKNPDFCFMPGSTTALKNIPDERKHPYMTVNLYNVSNKALAYAKSQNSNVTRI